MKTSALPREERGREQNGGVGGDREWGRKGGRGRGREGDGEKCTGLLAHTFPHQALHVLQLCRSRGVMAEGTHDTCIILVVLRENSSFLNQHRLLQL